jgi:hypothetical protein
VPALAYAYRRARSEQRYLTCQSDCLIAFNSTYNNINNPQALQPLGGIAYIRLLASVAIDRTQW